MHIRLLVCNRSSCRSTYFWLWNKVTNGDVLGLFSLRHITEGGRWHLVTRITISSFKVVSGAAQGGCPLSVGRKGFKELIYRPPMIRRPPQTSLSRWRPAQTRLSRLRPARGQDYAGRTGGGLDKIKHAVLGPHMSLLFEEKLTPKWTTLPLPQLYESFNALQRCHNCCSGLETWSILLVCLHPRWRVSDRLPQSLRYLGRVPSSPTHGFCNVQTWGHLRCHWIHELSRTKTFCALQVFLFELPQ